MKWPGGFEEYVKIMHKTTVGVAGTMQAGKTAYLLNVAWANKDLIPTYYFTSEFGADELRNGLELLVIQWELEDSNLHREIGETFRTGFIPTLKLIDYLEVSTMAIITKWESRSNEFMKDLKRVLRSLGYRKSSEVTLVMEASQQQTSHVCI